MGHLSKDYQGDRTNSRGKDIPDRAVVGRWGQGGLSPRGHLAMARSIFDCHKNDSSLFSHARARIKEILLI